jgi:hypothetical protein
MKSLSESDWKVLRDLKPALLERYCARALDDIRGAARAQDGEAHERYLGLVELVRRRDKKLARMFDDLRRSNGLLKLALMYESRLLTPEEFRRFGAETRKTIESVVAGGA